MSNRLKSDLTSCYRCACKRFGFNQTVMLVYTWHSNTITIYAASLPMRREEAEEREVVVGGFEEEGCRNTVKREL